ncbi:MAG TPA: hypothetical protein VGY76_11945 [Solirubrobacteraceae bacterium]|nr:hypothetical protein [Solirubrobacteraceae bacterium]
MASSSGPHRRKITLLDLAHARLARQDVRDLIPCERWRVQLDTLAPSA